MKKKIWIILMAGLFAFPFVAVAQNHQGSQDHAPAKETEAAKSHNMPHGHGHMMMNRPLQHVTVDGLKLSLDIMGMDMHMNMQKMKGNPVPEEFAKDADNAIMFYVLNELSRLIIDDADVHYVITGPKGEKEKGIAKWYGDHYGAPFKLRKKGHYALEFIVEADGKKSIGKFTHEIK